MMHSTQISCTELQNIELSNISRQSKYIHQWGLIEGLPTGANIVYGDDQLEVHDAF